MSKKKNKLKNMANEEIQKFMKEGLENLEKIQSEREVENLIKDNKIEFGHKNSKFRVRKPTAEENREIAQVARKKYTELVKDDSFMFEHQWIKILKEKHDVDINKMKNEMVNLNSQMKPLLMKMAQTSNKKALKKLKTQIENKEEKQKQLNLDIANHLEYCIENQTKIYETGYMAYKVTEVKTTDGWEKVFKDYKSYEECEEYGLLNKIHYYLSMIIYRYEEPEVGEEK